MAKLEKINLCHPPLEYLITGTGRCGTKYLATLLSANGLLCTHEELYRGDGYRPNPVIPNATWRDLKAECSWHVLFHLDQAINAGVATPKTTLVHLVRHPLHVVRSWAYLEGCGPQRYDGLAMRWVYYNEIIDLAKKWWPGPTKVLRVEQSVDQLLAAFELKRKSRWDDRQTNSRAVHVEGSSVNWSDLNEDTREQLTVLTKSYGYEV